MKASATRDGCEDGPVPGAVGGGKRKAGSDVDDLGSGGEPRETRRTRARRIAQDRELMPPPSLTANADLAATLELDDVRPQASKTVGRTVR